ncbi:hypothetical protein AGR1B_pa0202 [Agrobacterium fabacearum S56]|nr:hypothetical protein AGR1B_pa0202 [Agrobacterium fabacearum S56]
MAKSLLTGKGDQRSQMETVELAIPCGIAIPTHGFACIVTGRSLAVRLPKICGIAPHVALPQSTFSILLSGAKMKASRSRRSALKQNPTVAGLTSR